MLITWYIVAVISLNFDGGGATMLKEHLVGKGGNISRCNKCPPNICNYFLRELQRIRERKKAKKEEKFH
jgi:hypothetical protein